MGASAKKGERAKTSTPARPKASGPFGETIPERKSALKKTASEDERRREPHMVTARFLIATLLGFLLIAAATGTPAATAGISGSWSGTLVRSRQALDVRITFSREPSGQYNGTYSSNAQAVMDYPFDSVTVAGRRVAFVLGGRSCETPPSSARRSSSMTLVDGVSSAAVETGVGYTSRRLRSC